MKSHKSHKFSHDKGKNPETLSYMVRVVTFTRKGFSNCYTGVTFSNTPPPMCDNFLAFMGLHPIIPYLLWACHNYLITCKFMGNLWDTCPYKVRGLMNRHGVLTWYTGTELDCRGCLSRELRSVPVFDMTTTRRPF